MGPLVKIGGTKNPDIDAILALRPELVIASQEENRRRDVERLEAAGIRVLDNDIVRLDAVSGDAPLYLAAIGSHYANRDRGAETVARVPEEAARIVLMHHPDSFTDLPAHSAPLAIAGHTHGGQFRPPFNRQWSLLNLIQKDQVYTEGWIDDVGAAGNRLYVNRGLGFSILPLRINAPPEVTFFTLR